MTTAFEYERRIKIVMFSNMLIHHSVTVTDALYADSRVDFRFVAAKRLIPMLRQNGYYDYSSRPYCVCVADSEENRQLGERLVMEADVLITGYNSDPWVHNRLRHGKLTFLMSEHWFRGDILKKLLHPLFWKGLYKNFVRFRKKPYYYMCMSGFSAGELKRLGLFRGKCYKWGYFPLPPALDIEEILGSKRDDGSVRLLWVARMLKLKHPELVVRLAQRLKTEGRRFVLDMYGTGEELEPTRSLIARLGVDDCVKLCGNLPNERMLEEFRRHHIFMFTSDHREGWGAVVNEAMSNGCAVVADSRIGSVPYLLDDGVNGMIFRDRSLDDLCRCVTYLMDHPEKREEMTRSAYLKVTTLWSPEHAAREFVKLAQSALEGHIKAPADGPCSKA